MKKFRAKKTGQDTSVLQRRAFLLFWTAIAYGTTHTMNSRAIQMERAHLRQAVLPGGSKAKVSV